MHANLSITDGIYAVLSDNEVGERIAKLGENKPEANREIVQQLEGILQMLK